MSHFKDVKKFHEKFGLLVGRKPQRLTIRKMKERIEFLQEELDELKSAVESDNFPEQADALVDIVYVALGTAVMMGLPWKSLWDDVQRANMEKVRGVTKRGHAVDCMKPEGWIAPWTAGIVWEHGFDPDLAPVDDPCMMDNEPCMMDNEPRMGIDEFHDELVRLSNVNQ